MLLYLLIGQEVEPVTAVENAHVLLLMAPHDCLVKHPVCHVNVLLAIDPHDDGLVVVVKRQQWSTHVQHRIIAVI